MELFKRLIAKPLTLEAQARRVRNTWFVASFVLPIGTFLAMVDSLSRSPNFRIETALVLLGTLIVIPMGLIQGIKSYDQIASGQKEKIKSMMERALMGSYLEEYESE